VIEQVTGKSYDSFVKSVILEPAGAGGMLIAGDALSERRPKEVVYQGDYAYAMQVHRMDSHGGWIGTASDLVKFAQRVDGYKSVPDLLSRKSTGLMATPTRVYSGYGRGWTLNPRHRNRWHTGRLSGTTSILVRVDGDACFAGLVNTSGAGLDEALDALMWDIYAEVMG
jgi:CubicO group peptidase (beta-lactamase class C family)